MKENINNLRRAKEVRKALTENNISDNSIAAIEKAVKNGLVFRRAADLAILNLPAADLAAATTTHRSSIPCARGTYRPRCS